ncbi:MAG: tetratricopeptide repeat protein [Rhodospirillales bacterium]|nr:tetratricopeptide repeat protein [Rhodospirillales bacterium]
MLDKTLQDSVSQTRTSGFLLANMAQGSSAKVIINSGAGSDGHDNQSSQLSMAKSAHERGHLDLAENIYRDILKAEPKNFKALTLYGILFNQREKFTEAHRLLKKSNIIQPNQVETCNALGMVLRNLNKTKDSFKAYNNALEVDPDCAAVLVNMGVLLRETGAFEDSAVSFKRALDIDPTIPEAWNGFSRTQKFSELPHHIDSLEALSNNPTLSNIQRKHALFALAKIHNDVGLYDKAFGFYKKGNQQNEVKANSVADKAYMEQIASVFTARFIADAPSVRESGKAPVPVLILGMPRSGTTLVEQIVATHPQADWGGELHYFTEVIQKFKRYTSDGSDQYPDSVEKLTAASMTEIRKGFFKRFESKGPSKKSAPLIVTDKTPFNFLYIGLIAMALPEAKIINCRRDPMDNALSIFMTDFSNNMPFTTDLSAIGHYICGYRKLMEHWVAMKTFSVLDVDYEDLIHDQETVSRKLIEFCGLKWDKRCLEFHDNKRQVSTPSDWQVRQPIYDNSIGRWKNYEVNLQQLQKIVEN